MGDQDKGRSAAAHPLDILLRKSFEPVETVFGDLEGEEVGDRIIIIGVCQDQLAFPLRVEQIEVISRYVCLLDLVAIVVELSKADYWLALATITRDIDT